MARASLPTADVAQPGKAPTVLVMGAGLLGGWLGGRLQVAGARVAFVGRDRMLQPLRLHGLTLVDPDGEQATLPPSELRLHEEVPPGLFPDLVLLCVKGGAVAEAATALNAVLPAGTLVLAMQHGIAATDVAQAAAPDLVLLRALAPFQVAASGPGRLQRVFDSRLAAQTHISLLPWLPWFEAAGLPMQLHADLVPLQWGQLLLNLNQAVNALSGLSLRAQLLDGDLRACTAALVSEALHLIREAGIQPAVPTGGRPAALARRLRLPTPLFRLAARRLLPADAQARAGMADDLARHRPTEIDAFQGEVLRLAARLGRLAPINARITQLVRSWSPRSLPMAGPKLRRQLGV